MGGLKKFWGWRILQKKKKRRREVLMDGFGRAVMPSSLFLKTMYVQGQKTAV